MSLVWVLCGYKFVLFVLIHAQVAANESLRSSLSSHYLYLVFRYVAQPYGVNFPGGTFKFGVTKENGKKRPAIGSQLVQSAYLSLQTPYILFGLGKTSAYIDTVLYGININNVG